jgi:hypothetical protein
MTTVPALDEDIGDLLDASDYPDDPMHGPGWCGCGEEDPWARGWPSTSRVAGRC